LPEQKELVNYFHKKIITLDSKLPDTKNSDCCQKKLSNPEFFNSYVIQNEDGS